MIDHLDPLVLTAVDFDTTGMQLKTFSAGRIE